MRHLRVDIRPPNLTARAHDPTPLVRALQRPFGPPARAVWRAGRRGRTGGDYTDERTNRRFTVNPDCTGSASIDIYEDGQLLRTFIFSIVVDDANIEIRMVQ